MSSDTSHTFTRKITKKIVKKVLNKLKLSWHSIFRWTPSDCRVISKILWKLLANTRRAGDITETFVAFWGGNNRAPTAPPANNINYLNGLKMKQFNVKFCVKISWLSIYNLLSRFHVHVSARVVFISHGKLSVSSFQLFAASHSSFAWTRCRSRGEKQTINFFMFYIRFFSLVFWTTITSSSFAQCCPIYVIQFRDGWTWSWCFWSFFCGCFGGIRSWRFSRIEKGENSLSAFNSRIVMFWQS